MKGHNLDKLGGDLTKMILKFIQKKNFMSVAKKIQGQNNEVDMA